MLNFSNRKQKGFPVIVETVASVNTIYATNELRQRMLNQAKSKK